MLGAVVATHGTALAALPWISALGNTVGSLGGNLLTGDMEPDLAARLGTSEEILHNHDLNLAVGKAIKAILEAMTADLEPGQDQNEWRRFATEVPKRWRILTVSGPGDTQEELLDVRLNELIAVGADKREDATVLSPKDWRWLLDRLAEQSGEELTKTYLGTNGRELAGKQLHEGFARALREVLKWDFSQQGRAYPAMVLALLGDIHHAVSSLRDTPLGADLQRRLATIQAEAQKELLAAIQNQNTAVIEAVSKTEQAILVSLGFTLSAIQEVNSRVAGLHEKSDQIIELLQTGGVSRSSVAQKPISLLYPSLGPIFKGRITFLESLHQSLEANQTSRTTSVVSRVLYGLGGVGKTRLAVEYAHRYAESYSALLFVSSDTPAKLRRNLAALSGGIVPGPDENTRPEIEDRQDAVLNWLRANPGWLLILDNADSEEAAIAVEDLLAELHGGTVLITSRLSQWSSGLMTQEIDVLPPDASAEFILERTDGKRRATKSDPEEAEKLANSLGCLALALEQAGAYIAFQKASILEFRRDWEAQRAAVQRWYNPRLMKYPHSVAMTWEATLQHLQAEEVALLRMLSFFSPEPIPCFLLDGEGVRASFQACVELLAIEDPTRPKSEISVRDSLSTLANYSMVQRDNSVSGESVSIHRVVQDLQRSRVPPSSKQDWLRLALQALLQSLPGDPTELGNRAQWDLLLPHHFQVVTMADEENLSEHAAPLMCDLGVMFYHRSQFSEAEAMFRRSLEVDEQTHGPNHPVLLPRLNNLAILLQETKRFGESEPLLKRALDISKSTLGDQSREFAISLNNLALLYWYTSRYEEAEPLMRQVVPLFQLHFGENHPHVATALSNLALLLDASNRQGEGEQLLWKVLGIDEAAYGAHHPDVARDLTNLARVLQGVDRLPEALPLMRRAQVIIATHRHRYSDPHPRESQIKERHSEMLHLAGWSQEEIELEREKIEEEATQEAFALRSAE